MKLHQVVAYLFFLCAIVLLIGCDQQITDEPISTAPEIEIMSPAIQEATFKSGERVLIQVDFNDDVELHEMAVLIKRIADNEIVYQRNLHKHGNRYRWIEDTTFTVTSSTTFNIIAIATDHELQRSETMRMFIVEAN